MPVHVAHRDDFFTHNPATGEVTSYDGRFDAHSFVTFNSARVRPSGCATRQRKAAELRSLQVQNASLVRQVEALINSNDTLTRSNGRLAEILSKSNRDIADLKTTVRRLEEHNASLVAEVANSWFRSAEAQGRLSQQEAKADALLDQLCSLAQAHEALKTSAFASERAASHLAARDLRITELEHRVKSLDDMLDRVEAEAGRLGFLDDLTSRLRASYTPSQATDDSASVEPTPSDKPASSSIKHASPPSSPQKKTASPPTRGRPPGHLEGTPAPPRRRWV